MKMPESPFASRNLVSRLCVIYHFMLEGILVGIWSSFLPTFRDKLSLSDTELGSSVLFVYLGTVFVTPVAAFCINYLGSARSTALGALLFGTSLPFIAMSPSFATLTVAHFWFGWTMGIMDVSMNSCAVLVELVAHTPLMGSFHGSYSIAAAVGSLIGGALVTVSLNTTVLFTIISCITVILSITAYRNQYNQAEEKIIVATEKNDSDLGNAPAKYEAINKEDDDSTAALLTSSQVIEKPINSSSLQKNENTDKSNDVNAVRMTLFFICCVGFIASFGEGSVVTWSVLYYGRYLPFTDHVTQSVGFTAFMVCMALGRFSCDFLRLKFGRQLIVKVSGILAASGVLLSIFAPIIFGIDANESGDDGFTDDGSTSNHNAAIAFTTIGFALTGCGLSTLIPTMFSTAGHLASLGTSGNTIAMVAGFTYTGSIVCSPMLGGVSDALNSLRFAFFINVGLMALISPLGFAIPPEDYSLLKMGSIDENQPLNFA